MPNKMLIDASHPEETRVVVTRGNRIEEFDFESQDKKQLRGNIYLARVTRVEPSLQAAFVEYGGNRHGFLAFSEIHPDYYQIPVADRQALLLADAEEAEAEDEEDEEERSGRRRRRGRNGKNRNRDEERKASQSGEDAVSEDASAEDAAGESENLVGIEPFEQDAPAAFLSEGFALPPESGSDEDEADASRPHGDAEAADGSSTDVAAEGKAEDGATEEQPALTGDTEAGDSGTSDEKDNKDGPAMAAAIEGDAISEPVPEESDGAAVRETAPGDDGDDNGAEDNDGDDNSSDDNGGDNNGDDEVESVGAEDAFEEAQPRRRPARRQYKIQEVIKRRQILLVQVVKEERGNKGAALTTYLSLAGRYSVLMPNTARGGGISRKITNAQDRKRLKEVMKDLEVPQGMGVILRTAGESRTKAEIKRDYEYLMRMWENVRTLTLQSTAPALVYEEGSLIKRSVRDLYNKDIDEILVAGEEGYREAKDFMRMLMPSHAKMVQPYRDNVPIFARSGIEAQLDRMLQPQVNLKSGGYIIINQTEALVAIDVNSGRSTKEHSIEDTALQTNLEAADEVARQLRLRDLAGLIVVDFIDMEENRNNRAVEKRMKDALKNDRARIQVGRISHFGLLEMSRQRIRTSVLESTTQTCPHCGGTGHIRSESSVALHVIRAIEEYLLKDTRHHITVRTPVSTALYVLNHKRSTLVELERRFGLTISLEADETLGSQHYAISKGAAVENPVTIVAPTFAIEEEEDDIIENTADEEEMSDEAANGSRSESSSQNGEDGHDDRKRKRRRRRRGGRDREHTVSHSVTENGDSEQPLAANADADLAGDEETPAEAQAEEGTAADGEGKKRRRGKRGGRRNRRGEDETGSEDVASEASEASEAVAASDEPVTAADATAGTTADVVHSLGDEAVAAIESQAAPEEAVQAEAEAEAGAGAEAPAKPAPKKRTRKTKAMLAAEAAAAAAASEAAEQPVTDEANATEAAPAAPEAPVESVVPAEPAKDAEAMPAAEPASAEETAPEAAEPQRASRRRTTSDAPSEPVLTSTAPEGEAPAPRKGGWWQRKSFF